MEKETFIAQVRVTKSGQKRITAPIDSSLVGNDYVMISKVDTGNLDLLKQKHVAINVQFKNKERVNFSNIKRQVKKE